MTQRHHIRAWRRLSGLTVQAIADAIHRDKGTVSKIINEKQDYTQTTLEGIADRIGIALKRKIEAADLLRPPPSDTNPVSAIMADLHTLNYEQQLQVMRAVRAMFGIQEMVGEPKRKRKVA